MSADTNTTDTMIKLLCVGNWEESLSIPKREMEIQGKRVEEGGHRRTEGW